MWALLKQGYNGVYHNWSRRHCYRYVNEVSFRLNLGNFERDTRDRVDSLFRSMVGMAITFEALTA